jgi:hypothetical protein
MDVQWSEIGWSDKDALSVRDLWQHRALGRHRSGYRVTVASHDVAMWKVGP